MSQHHTVPSSQLKLKACLFRAAHNSAGPSRPSPDSGASPVHENGTTLKHTSIKNYTGPKVLRTWANSPSWGRRCDISRYATAFEVFNAEFSPIYRLVLDIQIQILEYLKRPDHIALRLTSRRYASIVQVFFKRKSSQSDKRAITKRLNRDRYFKLAQAEDKFLSTTSKQLLCSACQTTHCSSSFSTNEFLKSAHTRRCKGTTGTLRACSHDSFTWRDVLKHPNLRPAAPGQMIHLHSIFPAFQACRSNPFVVRERASGDVFLGSQLELLSYTTADAIPRSAIATNLCIRQIQICPHMRTDGPKFLAAVMYGPCGKRRNGYNDKKKLTAVFAKPGKKRTMCIKCERGECDSWVLIKAFMEKKGARVEMVSLRCFGGMESAVDRRWVVQLEQVGRAEGGLADGRRNGD